MQTTQNTPLENHISYEYTSFDNALYKPFTEFDIPDKADNGVLKDEEAELLYGENKKAKLSTEVFLGR